MRIYRRAPQPGGLPRLSTLRNRLSQLPGSSFLRFSMEKRASSDSQSAFVSQQTAFVSGELAIVGQRPVIVCKQPAHAGQQLVMVG
jgi:hypothetical protein